MKDLYLIAGFALAFQLFQGCTASTVHHEPRAAIAVAEKFAKYAFVEKDFEGAFALASDAKATLKAGALESAVMQIQGSAPFPDDLRAVAYEIPFGTERVVVYLEGKGENRTSYYQIVTVGDSTSGYSVMEVFRADSHFPKGPLQEPVR